MIQQSLQLWQQGGSWNRKLDGHLTSAQGMGTNAQSLCNAVITGEKSAPSYVGKRNVIDTSNHPVNDDRETRGPYEPHIGLIKYIRIIDALWKITCSQSAV